MSTISMTAEQQTKFIELAGIALLKKKEGGQASKGAYAPVYEYLIECFAPTVSALLKVSDIYTEVDVVANAALSASLSLAIAALDETTRYSVIWLIGAAGVNTGDGVFSSVIREYNIYQVQLRYDQILTGNGADGKDLIQDASNAVGFLLANQIVTLGYTLPSVKQIGGGRKN